MCIKCCHEAAHAVIAIKFNLHFREVVAPYFDGNNVISGLVRGFSAQDSSLHNFKLAIVSGCLGEFYPEWKNKMAGAEFMRSYNHGFSINIQAPIEKTLTVFSKESYKDDFNCYTQDNEFNIDEFKKHLDEAFLYVDKYWGNIEKVASRLHEIKIMSHDDVLQMIGVSADD